MFQQLALLQQGSTRFTGKVRRRGRRTQSNACAKHARFNGSHLCLFIPGSSQLQYLPLPPVCTVRAQLVGGSASWYSLMMLWGPPVAREAKARTWPCVRASSAMSDGNGVGIGESFVGIM